MPTVADRRLCPVVRISAAKTRAINEVAAHVD